MQPGHRTHMQNTSPHADKTTLRALAGAAAEGFRCLSVSAGGHSAQVGGAPCWYCSSSVPVFNGAGIFVESLLEPSALLGITEYFSGQGRPYSLVTVDGLTPDATGRLRSQGFVQYDSMPAMWLDGVPRTWPGQKANPDLWLSQVQTPTDMATFRSILSGVFHISREEAELVLGDSALAVPGVRHCLGWVRGEPVGTLSVVLSGPVPSIWNVATLPQHRRHGVAAGMMRSVLLEATLEGHASNMLLASTEGVPLYERLGYKTVSTVRVFVPGRERENVYR